MIEVEFHEKIVKYLKKIDIAIQKAFFEARTKGREEGIKEGIEKEKYILAERLIKKNMPLEEIAEITELPIEKIQEIAVKKAG